MSCSTLATVPLRVSLQAMQNTRLQPKELQPLRSNSYETAQQKIACFRSHWEDATITHKKDNGMHTEESVLPSQSLPPRPPGAGRIMSKSAKFFNALNVLKVLYLTARNASLLNTKLYFISE